jgi:hypothetical protein
MRLAEVAAVNDDDPLIVSLVKRKISRGERVYFVGASGRERRVLDVIIDDRSAAGESAIPMFGIRWPRAAPASTDGGTSWRNEAEVEATPLEPFEDADGVPSFRWRFGKSGLI